MHYSDSVVHHRLHRFPQIILFIFMDINELTYKIIGCAYDVHKELGPGLLESTYEKCLCFEFEKLGIKQLSANLAPLTVM